MVINERLIPGGRVGQRSDQTAGGRIVTMAGEIRNDPDYVLRLEELRTLGLCGAGAGPRG